MLTLIKIGENGEIIRHASGGRLEKTVLDGSNSEIKEDRGLLAYRESLRSGEYEGLITIYRKYGLRAFLEEFFAGF